MFFVKNTTFCLKKTKRAFFAIFFSINLPFKSGLNLIIATHLDSKSKKKAMRNFTALHGLTGLIFNY